MIALLLAALQEGELEKCKGSLLLSGRLLKQATLEQAAKGASSLLALIIAKNGLVDCVRADIAC